MIQTGKQIRAPGPSEILGVGLGRAGLLERNKTPEVQEQGDE